MASYRGDVYERRSAYSICRRFAGCFQRNGINDPNTFSGYWHIGFNYFNYSSNWPSYPFDYYFQGSLSEAAVWDSTALSATQVSNHYNAAAGGNYDATVLGDSPTSYWKLNESSGTTFADATTGNDAGAGQILQTNGSYIGNVTLGIPGANSGDNAITLDGSTGYVSTLTVAPNPQGQQFTEEIWFKTTTTQGGTLMGFNDAFSGVPGNWDRTFYMTNSGTLRFGVWTPSGTTTVVSP